MQNRRKSFVIRDLSTKCDTHLSVYSVSTFVIGKDEEDCLCITGETINGRKFQVVPEECYSFLDYFSAEPFSNLRVQSLSDWRKEHALLES